jgi:DNA polymerase delta subunit 1
MTGMNWIELSPSTYTIRTPSSRLKIGHAQIEVDVYYTDLVSHVAEGPWSLIPKLRVLSFDIECAGRKGVFPDASIDPVIQIANMVISYGEPTPFIRNVFCLKTCGNIAGTQVLSFERESDLLLAWSKFFSQANIYFFDGFLFHFFLQVDPDVVTGYNIANFDFPYLLDRAITLNVSGFPYLGRIAGSMTKARDTTFSSKAYGTRESKTFSKSYF